MNRIDISIDEQIRLSRLLMGNPYAYLDEDAESGFSAIDARDILRMKIRNMCNRKNENAHTPIDEIEIISRNIQLEIWKCRAFIFNDRNITDPIKVLDPSIALKLLGYEVTYASSLGHFYTKEGQAEMAGYIDEDNKSVCISSHFPSSSVKFTTAHELGHAILHRAQGLHRDRSLDGGAINSNRDHREKEADKFATLFLMPKKQVRKEFIERFTTNKFEINDISTYHLKNEKQEVFRNKIRSTRDLSRLLAGVKRYGNMRFVSMNDRFNVSLEAMAIRIEELGLVET